MCRPRPFAGRCLGPAPEVSRWRPSGLKATWSAPTGRVRTCAPVRLSQTVVAHPFADATKAPPGLKGPGQDGMLDAGEGRLVRKERDDRSAWLLFHQRFGAQPSNVGSFTTVTSARKSSALGV
jgi:hypothetical protein